VPPRKTAARAARALPTAQSATNYRPRGVAYGAALALIIAFTYVNSLSGAFVLDDQAAIVQNPQIRDLSRLDDILAPVPDSPVAGRPLANLSFALNYAVGGFDVRGYHIVNIALHILCALLVLAVVWRTVARWNTAHDGGLDATGVAVGAALLWGVHPLNSEVVNYLSQRTESLMAVCYLATLYAAIRAAGEPRAVGRTRWEALAVLGGLAGALCKESIATAPLVVAVYDRVFVFDSWRAQWTGRRRLYAGLACTWIVVGLLVADGPRAAVVGFSTGVSPWVYLLNQAQVITQYLQLALWPDALVAFYGWPQPVSLADVAPHVAVVGSLFVLTGIALWKRPAVGFLGVWFFVTLAPASSIVPVSTEVGAERRMYLPLIALAVLAAVAVEAAMTRVLRGQPFSPAAVRVLRLRPAVAVLVAAALLSTLTIARNREYGSPLTLAETIVARRPTAVAHHMLGEELVRAGRHDQAVPHLRAAVEQGNSRARYLLGQVFASRDRHNEAIEQLEAFVRTHRPPKPLVPQWLEPPLAEVVPARFLLGRAYGLRGDWARAAEQGQLILDLVPSHIGARGLLGDAMFARQQWAAAAEHYRAYLQRQPNDTGALMNYGVAQVGLERLDAAVAAFARASEVDPTNARAKELLAMAERDRANLAAAR
jgi:tetratricopeptide (TPR) repeat protein